VEHWYDFGTGLVDHAAVGDVHVLISLAQYEL
jgi:hypothetical protein